MLVLYVAKFDKQNTKFDECLVLKSFSAKLSPQFISVLLAINQNFTPFTFAPYGMT